MVAAQFDPGSTDAEAPSQRARGVKRWAVGGAAATLLGTLLVLLAWILWPDGAGLPFDIVFSVGMLGVNAGWAIGVGTVVAEVRRAGWRGVRPAVLGWSGLAILVAQGVFGG